MMHWFYENWQWIRWGILLFVIVDWIGGIYKKWLCDRVAFKCFANRHSPEKSYEIAAEFMKWRSK